MSVASVRQVNPNPDEVGIIAVGSTVAGWLVCTVSVGKTVHIQAGTALEANPIPNPLLVVISRRTLIIIVSQKLKQQKVRLLVRLSMAKFL